VVGALKKKLAVESGYKRGSHVFGAMRRMRMGLGLISIRMEPNLKSRGGRLTPMTSSL